MQPHWESNPDLEDQNLASYHLTMGSCFRPESNWGLLLMRESGYHYPTEACYNGSARNRTRTCHLLSDCAAINTTDPPTSAQNRTGSNYLWESRVTITPRKLCRRIHFSGVLSLNYTLRRQESNLRFQFWIAIMLRYILNGHARSWT